MSRRALVGGGVAAAGAAVVGGVAVLHDQKIGKAAEPSIPVDRVVHTTCSPNCTGSCGQLAFVRDDKVVKIQQAADYPDLSYDPPGCMKGLSYHLQIYNEDRVLSLDPPMRRIQAQRSRCRSPAKSIPSRTGATESTLRGSITENVHNVPVNGSSSGHGRRRGLPCGPPW